MRITKLKVETFKSLYNVECDFENFNVVTGPNGSGKSNLVDALRFLGDAYTHGLEFAVSRAGGIENIAHRRTRRAKRAVGFSVTAVFRYSDLDNVWFLDPESNRELATADEELVLQHRFSFKTWTQTVRADFAVEDELLTITTSNGHELVRLSRQANSFDIVVRGGPRKSAWRKQRVTNLIRPFNERSLNDWVASRATRTMLMFSETGFPGTAIAAVRDYLANIGVFQLSPHVSRAPGVPTPNAVLEQHGENLPGAAYNLMRTSPEAWVRVTDAMRLLLPNLSSIEIANTEDRRLALQFREDGVGRAWTSGEVSDGTIQSLALLVALFDPRSRLLVIEEPENAVHPWILRNFLDLCISADKQILLTSHSPILLNYVDPHVIQLMWMHSGRSTVRRLLDMNAEASAALISGDLSVFDIYDSGLLRQTVPRGLGGAGDE